MGTAEISSLKMWARPSVTGTPPAARCAHAVAVCGEEIGNAKLYVYGGWNGTRMLNDLHLFYYDRMTWSRPITTGVNPSPRAGHSMNAVGTKLFVFGGGDGAHYLNDLHVLDTETLTWSQCYVTGQSPAARSRHSGTLGEGGKKLYIFGGGDDSRVYNDIFILDIESMSWTRPEVQGVIPSARWGHTCSLVEGGNILLFGGHDGAHMLSDMFVFDTHTLTWIPIPFSPSPLPPSEGSTSSKDETPLRTPSQGPSARAGHTSTYVGKNRIIVFGGGDGTKILNDCWWGELNESKSTEIHRTSSPPPPSQGAPTSAPPQEHSRPSYSFQWNLPQINGTAPLGRCAHTSLVLDNKLIIFGGGDGSRRFKDLYILDLEIVFKNEEKKALKSSKKLIKQRKSQLTKSTEELKCRDITLWLTSLGLKKYSDQFIAQDVDMDILPFLTESHLEQLGVNTIGAKIKIMNAIKAMAPSQATTDSKSVELVGVMETLQSCASSLELASLRLGELIKTSQLLHNVEKRNKISNGRRNSLCGQSAPSEDS